MRLIAVFAACFLYGPALAQQGQFGQRVDFAALTLHAGWAEQGRRVAGLRMQLQPGWKTYWRNPGETGIPPRIDWSGSVNLAALRIDWPAPEAIESFGATTLGYAGRLVLPLTLTPEDPAKPIRLRLGISYGVCRDICVPAFEELALDIPPGAAEDGAYFIRSALARRPQPGAEAGLIGIVCSVEGAGARRRFAAELAYAQPVAAPPIVAAEGPDGVWIGSLETHLVDGRVRTEGRVETAAGRWVDRSAIRFTVLTEDGAHAHTGCAALR